DRHGAARRGRPHRTSHAHPTGRPGEVRLRAHREVDEGPQNHPNYHRQRSENPPSTSSVCPVIHAAPSDRSHATTGAMSRGVPHRPAGMRAATAARVASSAHAVSTGPGLMQLTVAVGASALASERVMPWIAALLAAYAISFAIGPRCTPVVNNTTRLTPA